MHASVVVHHKIPESFKALFSIVSLTAANTNRILEVSVACVKLPQRQSMPVEVRIALLDGVLSVAGTY